MPAAHPRTIATLALAVATIALCVSASGCDAEHSAHASEIEPPAPPAAETDPTQQRSELTATDEPTAAAPLDGPPRWLDADAPLPSAHFDPSVATLSLPALDAVDEHDRGDIFHLEPAADRLVALASPGNRWLESTDGGTTWSSWRTEQAVGAVLPTDGRYWYGLGDMDPDGRTHRLARTEDAGRTWEWRITGRKIEPESFALIARIDGELSLAVGPDVLVSRDMDRFRWQDVGLDDLTRITSLDYLTDGRLAVGTDHGQVAVRNDDEWIVESIPGLERHRVTAVADVGDTRVAATHAGVWRRTTDGSWSRVEALGARDYRALWVGGQVVVAVGAAAELAASIDGGETFVRYTDRVRSALELQDPARAIHFVFHDVVATETGLAIAGNDWTLLEVRSDALQR